jgi:hypothetical protein
MKTPLRKKSRFERVLDHDPAKMSKAIRSGVADNPVKSGVIAAGSVVGLTAGSAALSAVRRRGGRSQRDS